MFVAVHGVKHYAHFCTWSNAFLLIAIHGVKHYAHFDTWSNALCSLL